MTVRRCFVVRNLLTTVTIAVALSTCTLNPAPAQQRPGQPPPPGETPNCQPVGELRADAQVTRLMQDNDGDWWAMVRFTSTGRLLIGFVSRASGKFCVTGEGKTSPEA